MQKRSWIVYLLVLVFILPILYFWWSNSGIQYGQPVGVVVMALGRLCGLLGAASILVQVLLRSRIQPVERLVGFMAMDRLHKKNGYVAISLLVLHPILLTIGFSVSSHKSLVDQFLTFLFQYEDVFDAFLGLSLLILVICTSVYIVRKKLPYHWWFFIHLTVYIAILLAFNHQLQNGEDFLANQWFAYYWYFLYAVVFGNLIYWKIIRVAYMYFKHRFFVSEIIRESHDTVSVYIRGRKMEDLHWKAGQFAFIHVLSKALWWDVHPFSISCEPNPEYVRFTIKASGDFTKQVPAIPLNTPVLLDMPHGEFTLDLTTRKKLLFIAGGVGLTPLRAMLGQAGTAYDSVLVFANKTEADIILKSELEKISAENHVPIFNVMSGDPDYPGLKGYVTVDLLKSTVPDFMERDIYLCGPPVMMGLVSKALTGAGFVKERIYTEEFSL